MVDYSRWEALAKEEELREQEEAAALKAQKRESYLKAQKERAEKLHANSEQSSNHLDHHTCGCSMRMPSNKDPKDQMPIHERNLLKIDAIKAAKTDGNRLFKEDNLDLCLQVYERGVLICNGAYSLTDAQQDEVDQLELALGLNIAQVYLKQGRWTEAISQCKMALQLDPSSVKAFYRMALAYDGKGEYQQARAFLEQAKQKCSEESKRRQIEARIQTTIIKDRLQALKAKEMQRQIGARIANAK